MPKQQPTPVATVQAGWSSADLGTLAPGFVHPAGPQYDGVTTFPGKGEGRGQAVAFLLAVLVLAALAVATLIYQ